MTAWLVTGAGGFIGSNLIEKLLEREQRVVGLDDFSTGRRENIARLRGAFPRADFHMIEADIRTPGAAAAAAVGIDVVVHLAAQVSVQKSIDDPVDNDSINVNGFLAVVDAARRAGVKRMVYASSCAVYGHNPELPLTEQATPYPQSPYAVSKYANDLYAAVFRGLGGATELIGLRFFNIFGPHQDAASPYASVIPKWASLLLRGARPVIFGDGEATRDFCFVDNAVSAVIKAGIHPAPLSRPVYNIGTGTKTRLIDLYAGIVDVLSAAGHPVADIRPDFQPWRDGEITHSLASIAAATEFGYTPTVLPREGLQRLLATEYGSAPR